jgi:hypothetical protein
VTESWGSVATQFAEMLPYFVAPIRHGGKGEKGFGMSVRYECFVLSVRGLCNELITRPEDSYRLWCLDGCDLETS